MSGTDSLIRERIASAAAFDIATDPRRVREGIVRRQRRIKRRRRTTALLGVLAAAGLAVGVVRAVGQNGGDVAVRTDPSAPSDDAEASTESGPRFLPAPGWHALQGESTATAANVALGPDAFGDNLPWDTIERLEDGEVLLFGMFIPVGDVAGVDANFPPRALPLSLDDAHGGTFEGQPNHIASDRLAAQVNGWNIDMLVFYGSTDPTVVAPHSPDATSEVRAAAQEQLARLVVPAREPPVLSPAPDGACQPWNLRARVHLDNTDGTLVGRISVRNIGESTCTLEGRARLVEPVDVEGKVPSTTSEAAPAWRQEGAEPPDGWPMVPVAPQSEAQAVLRIRNWCVEPDEPVYFQIRLPYHTDRISGAAPSVRIPPQCEDPQMPMELSLGPFEPQRNP